MVGKAFLVCKSPLFQEQKLSDANAMVDEAAGWANSLVGRNYQGPGDTIEAARYRAEQKYGIPAHTFWALRYRKPKDMLVSVYVRLKCAYEHECERQEARLRHELALTREVLGSAAADDQLVVETEAFLEAVARKKESVK